MNLFNKLYIELLHPDLVQEFFSAEKVKYQTKTEFEKGTTGRILGDGLVYSEGNVWKMKKKVLTEVFSFDFLKSESTKIASLSEKVLNKM